MTHSIPNSPIPNSCEASNKSTTAGSFLVFPVRRLGTPSPTTINHCCQDLSRLRSAVSFHPGWKKAEELLWLLYVTLLPDMSLRLSVSLSLSPSPRDNMSWLGSFCFWQHLIATCCNSNFWVMHINSLRKQLRTKQPRGLRCNVSKIFDFCPLLCAILRSLCASAAT